MTEQPKKKKQGGARAGAGRKSLEDLGKEPRTVRSPRAYDQQWDAWQTAAEAAGLTRQKWIEQTLDAAATKERSRRSPRKRPVAAYQTELRAEGLKIRRAIKCTPSQWDAWTAAAESTGEPRQTWIERILDAAATAAE